VNGEHRDGGPICEVAHLGCHKPGPSDGERSGAAWARGRLMGV
jgi:hypothetical protein